MSPRHWLTPSNPVSTALRPVTWAFGCLRALRTWLYDAKIFKTHKLPHPVIVVGNVVAGGVGKTPVVIALVQRLLHMGYHPGVISRGYGRQGKGCQIVSATSTAAEVGDEPLLIARICQVPVSVASKRVTAAQALLASHPACNVLVSDDGLQHLALGRDIEIVLFDERGVGNNLLLPSGPLREPWPRKPRCRAHLVLNNVSRGLAGSAIDGNGKQYPLSTLANQTLNAIAGIAKPAAFFQMLSEHGLKLTSSTAYSDHDDFSKLDLSASLAANQQAIWLCTEKDAVKLWPRYPEHAHRILSAPLVIDLDATFLSVFDATIQSLMSK